MTPQLRTTWRRAAALLACWTFVAIIFALVSYGIGVSHKEDFTFLEALRLNAIQFYLWAILSPVLFRFTHRFPIEFRPFGFRRLSLYFPVLILFAAVHQTVHVAVLWSASAKLRHTFPALIECYRAIFGYGFYSDLIIVSLLVIAVHALLYYRDFRAGQLAQASLAAQLSQAQLRALKMQLHPHFLFNTLHSISSLVLEDPPRANSMIARLGDFLRLTLESSNRQLVSLEEETAFARCYLDIEQVRFGERLTVEFDLEPKTLSALVPHLILQPIVENAIQHAIAPRTTRGHIIIKARRVDGLLRLEVRDDGDGLPLRRGVPEGVGLSNVRARLGQVYKSDFRFELARAKEGGVAVVIDVPFVQDAESLDGKEKA